MLVVCPHPLMHTSLKWGCRFWFWRSEMGPEVRHVEPAPRRCQCCWSADHTLSREGLGSWVLLIAAVTAEGHKGRGSHLFHWITWINLHRHFISVGWLVSTAHFWSEAHSAVCEASTHAVFSPCLVQEVDLLGSEQSWNFRTPSPCTSPLPRPQALTAIYFHRCAFFVYLQKWKDCVFAQISGPAYAWLHPCTYLPWWISWGRKRWFLYPCLY